MIPVSSIIDRNRAAFVWGSALVFVLLLSLVLFLFVDNQQSQIVLFFPNYANHRLTGESRFVPRPPGLNRGVETVVNELILGPEQLRHDRALARETSVRALLVKGDTAYVDLSAGILFPAESVSLSFEESLQAIKRSIRFNFPSIKHVVITVEGQEPQSEVSANN